MGFAKSPGSGGGGILGNTGVEDGVESITRTFGMREVCILMPVFAGLLVGGGGDIGHGTPCPGDAGEGWGEGCRVKFCLRWCVVSGIALPVTR